MSLFKTSLLNSFCLALSFWVYSDVYAFNGGFHGSVKDSEIDKQTQITAALTYKLLLYSKFVAPYEIPNLCFVGTDSFAVAEAMKPKQESGDVQVTVEASLKSISVGQCHIIYISPLTRVDRSDVKALSKTALSIGTNLEFDKFGHTGAITFENSKSVLTFSKAQLNDSDVKLSSRLLSSVTVKP